MFQSFTHSGFNSQVWSTTQEATIGGVSPAVYLKAYGHVQCDGHFRLEQVHDLFACHLFEDGAGMFELDGTAHRVRAGQMVAVWPGVHARYHDSPETPWRYRWFTLAGETLVHVLKGAGLDETSPVVDGIASEHFAEVFARIESEFAADLVSPFNSIARGWDVVAKLAESGNTSEPGAEPSLASRAQCIIQQDYHRALQVEDLARRLGVSRATLFRHFRQELGVSPKAYLDDFRLSQAHELIKRGRSSVKEVAVACGYQCPHYFSNAYKKRYGTAPSLFNI